MTDSNVSKIPVGNELDTAQATDASGGFSLCDPQVLVQITQSLTQSYENLVDFTSHVIGRIAGE